MSNTPTHPIGILAGATATGKTAVALELAKQCPQLEIINADSLLVYQGLNIGTAKPTQAELTAVPHHLIDICEPHETFTAGQFMRAALAAIDQIHERGKRALIVGGTGFYLKALIFGIWDAPAADPNVREELNQLTNPVLFDRLHEKDPHSAVRIGRSDRYRLIRALELIELSGKTPTELQSQTQEPDPRFHLWVLDRSNPELQLRIQKRTQQMIQDGIIEEFQKIHAQYPECRPLHSVGYEQVGMYLNGKLPSGRKVKPGIEGLTEEIELATRQLVKKQRTWFRNQAAKIPQSQWFELDQQLPNLFQQARSIYT